MVYFWVALIVVFLIIEALTVQLVTIWFAAGAGGALVANMLHAPEWLQWVVFIVVSVVLLLATRPLVKKFVKKRVQPTNADRNVGREGIVIEAIDNIAAKGQVEVSGEVWTARSKDDVPIPEGQQVVIHSIEGVKLIVSAKEEK